MGVCGVLHTRPPLTHAAIALTVGTGRDADEHGIVEDFERDPLSGEPRPVSSSSCLSPALWNIVREAGGVAHAVGWPASDGPQPGEGVSLSERFFLPTSSSRELWPIPPGAVNPENRASEFAALRVHPSEFTGNDLLPMLPDLAAIDQATDKRPAKLATILARAAGVQAAATTLAAESGWQLLAVHHDLLAAASREFGSDPCVMQGLKNFAAAMVQRLIDLAEGACLFVVAASPSGSYALSGPNVDAGRPPETADTRDIAPTILAYLDVPVPADMPGRVLADWFIPPLQPCWGPAWAEAPAFLPATALPEDRRFRIAAVRLQYGSARAAIPLLEQLQEHAVARLCLGWAYLQCGRYGECREVLNGLPDDAAYRHPAHVLRAHLMYRMGDRDAAQRELSQLSDADVPAILHALASELSSDMGRAADAEAAARRGLHKDPESPASSLALASALLQLGRVAESAEAARECVRLAPRNAAAHLALGRALLAGGRSAEAERALRTSANLAPGSPAASAARQCLSRLGAA